MKLYNPMWKWTGWTGKSTLLAFIIPAAFIVAATLGLRAQSPGGGGTGGGGTTDTLPGFGIQPWAATFTQVTTSLKNLARSKDADERVEILQEVRNKYILVKRNDVLYRYNFYKTPWIVKRLDRNHKKTKEEYDAIEATLFHVKVTMPLIEAKMIKDRLIKKYKNSTESKVQKKGMEGVHVWELKKGIILQWVEPYQNVAFTRNIDYLSSDMVKIIMDEYRFYFNARERYILQKLQLQ